MQAYNILLFDHDKEELNSIIETLWLRFSTGEKGSTALEINPGIYEISLKEGINLFYFEAIPEDTQRINEIIKSKTITHLWVKSISNSSEKDRSFLEDARFKTAIKKIIDRDFQIAVFGYNEDFTNYQLTLLTKELRASFGSNPRIHIIETSPTYKVYFHNEEFISVTSESGDDSNKMISSNKNDFPAKHGKLVGHILADLFVSEIDSEFDIPIQKHNYNYFKRSNDTFVQFIKHLNSTVFKEKYLVGSVSFSAKFLNNDEYLIDSPYKPYSNLWDQEIANGNQSVLSALVNKAFQSKEQEKGDVRYFRLLYNINEEDAGRGGIFEYRLLEKSEGIEETPLIDDLTNFLPYLHSGIFFDEYGFNERGKQREVKHLSKTDTQSLVKRVVNKAKKIVKKLRSSLTLTHDAGSSDNIGPYIDVYYIMVKADFGGFNGELLISLYKMLSGSKARKAEKGKDNGKLEIVSLYSSEYKVLLHPKIEESLIPLYIKQTSIHAASAAISQVMSRNMAHNIGSHVSYRSTLPKINERIKALYGADAFKNKDSNGIADWLNYIFEKMEKFKIDRNEYLADFDTPPRNVMLYREVLLPFCENTLLFDNIAASEGLVYADKNESKLKVRCFVSGKEIIAKYPSLKGFDSPEDQLREVISYPDNFPYLVIHKSYNPISDAQQKSVTEGINQREITLKSPDSAEHCSDDPDVEITIHHTHGFYSILENFIRNSAKHNKSKFAEGKVLEIFIHLDKSENSPNFYTLTIFDNVSKMKGSELYNPDGGNAGSPDGKPDFYRRLRSALVDKEGRMVKSNLGFADMGINSYLFVYPVNYLEFNAVKRNLNLVIISSKNGKAEYQTVPCQLDKDTSYRFGFQMYISMPKAVLWIGRNCPPVAGAFVQSYNTLNDYFSYMSGSRDVSRTFAENAHPGIAAFSFVVFEYEIPRKEFDRFKVCLPSRVITAQVGSYNEISDGGQLLRWCWEKRLESIKKGVHFYIYLEEDKNEWLRAAEGNTLNLSENSRVIFLNNAAKNGAVVFDRSKLNIILDHHGRALQKFAPESMQDDDGNEDLNFYTEHRAVFFDKLSSDFTAIFYPPEKKEEKEILLFKLIEAAAANIFILDERIAHVANQPLQNPDRKSFGAKNVHKDKEITDIIWDMYAQAGVYVFSHFAKDNNNSAVIENPAYHLELLVAAGNVSISAAGMPLLEGIAGLNAADYDKNTIIIHRTYLPDNKTEQDAFLSALEKNFSTVCITSGGGYPHNLKTPVKFIPFSIVEKYVSRSISKYSLTNYLQSLVYSYETSSFGDENR